MGHVLAREKDNNCRVALTWIPEGKRRRGKPKIIRGRTVKAEQQVTCMRKLGNNHHFLYTRTTCTLNINNYITNEISPNGVRGYWG